MKRMYSGGAAFALCVLLVVLGGSTHAADVLNAVPTKALGVVVVNNADQTEEKLQKLAGQLQLPQLGVIAKLKSDLGIQKGLDDSGCFALAAIPVSQGMAPVAVLYVPVDDYQALIQQFGAETPVDGISKIVVGGKPSSAAEVDGYAIITERSNQAVLASVLASSACIADSTPALDDWRAETQAYAVATPAGVKFAQQQILMGLSIAKSQMGQAGVQSQQAIAGIEIYESFFKRIDQEISYTAAGLRIEADGDVHLVGRTLPAEGGVMAGLAANAKPGRADVLDGLPQMPFVFAGGGVMSAESLEPMMKASISMMKMYPGGENMTDEQFREIVQISLRSMEGMRSMAMMMGVGEGDEPLYSGLYIIIKADDAKQYMKQYLTTVRKMATIFKSGEFPFSYEVEPMDVDGRPGIKLAMGMSGMFGDQDIPGMENMMELMFGDGERMNVYMAVADEHTVLGSYVSKANLVKALASFDEGGKQLSDLSKVAGTLSALDKESQFIGLWSPQGTLAFAARMVAAINPGAEAAIPQVGETSPLGFSAKLSPAGLDTDALLPADALKTISVLIQQIIAQRQQQAPPGAL